MTRRPNSTPTPGLRVRRRGFLAFASSVLLGAALDPRRATADLAGEALEADDAAVSLDDFLQEVGPVALRLVEDTSRGGQDRYLHAVAAHACRLSALPEPEMRPSGQGDGAWIGFHPGGDPFTVLHWKLEPDASIRPHAHTYGNVVTVGLEGECTVWNWEPSGVVHSEADRPVDLLCTKAQRLGPGDTNLVSLRRNWCHGFRAGPGGAQGLDLTTRLRDRQPTPYLDLGPGEGRDVGAVARTRWVFDE